MVSRTLMNFIISSRGANKKVWLLACLFLLASLVISASAVVPIVGWQKALGGSDNDYAYSVKQTADGGYIVAGNSYSNNGDVTGNHGDSDFWVVKLDAAQNIQWQQSLGGTNEDFAYSVQPTTDGGYIVAGETRSTDGQVTGSHGSNDAWIVKLDSTGALVWQKALGGSNYDYASDIKETADGGFIVAASTLSNNGQVTGNQGKNDFWIVKLDSTGALVWQKAFGGSGDDYAAAIQQTVDGGYIVAGESNSVNGNVTGNHGLADYWIVKLDTLGNLVWQKSYGGPKVDFATSVQQTTDGGYIVAGESSSGPGSRSNKTLSKGLSDYWIVKLDPAGTLAWQNTFGGTGSDHAYSVWQTTDGGYAVAGGSDSTNSNVIGNHGATDFWVVKLSAAGVAQWGKPLGGTDFDHAYSIQQTSDKGFVIAGESFSTNGDVTGNHGNNDAWLAKLESIGTGPVVPNFVADVTQGYSPLTVQFTDTTTNEPGHWNWSFGDGTYSNLQNPSHTYTVAVTTTFTVREIVGNTFGNNAITKTGYITVAPAVKPAAKAGANVTSGISPLTVQFTDRSTNLPTSWLWNFGDGTTSTLQNPSHTYTTVVARSYNVSLSATNPYGTGLIKYTNAITVTP